MKPGFVVVDNHRRSDVHRIDEHKAFFYAALAKAVLHLRRDADEGYRCRRVKPAFFAIAFHDPAPKRRIPLPWRLCRNSVHGSRASPRTELCNGTYPFALSLSKGSERIATQSRRERGLRVDTKIGTLTSVLSRQGREEVSSLTE